MQPVGWDGGLMLRVNRKEKANITRSASYVVYFKNMQRKIPGQDPECLVVERELARGHNLPEQKGLLTPTPQVRSHVHRYSWVLGTLPAILIHHTVLKLANHVIQLEPNSLGDSKVISNAV